MSYRYDLEALAARHAALVAEVQAKTAERDDAQRLLVEARERAKLPVLDNIRVASPCTMAWNKMIGDERVRLCAHCDKHVYNLSGMTRDDAEALIIEKNGTLCVRYFQRKDGTILLADCTVGRKHKRNRRVFAAAAAAALAGGGLAALRSKPTDERIQQRVMAKELSPEELSPEELTHAKVHGLIWKKMWDDMWKRRIGAIEQAHMVVEEIEQAQMVERRIEAIEHARMGVLGPIPGASDDVGGQTIIDAIADDSVSKVPPRVDHE
jgi:hypothetical protein